MPNYIDEKSARRDIVEAGKRMYIRGFANGNDGNLSARISQNEIIATPTAVSKGFMREDELIKLDLEGNVLSGTLKPSSEIKLHLEIYKTTPDMAAVCHAHPPIATTFAAAGQPLDKAFLQESVVQLGIVPVAEYAAPGSDKLALEAAKFTKDYYACLLEAHGVVTWGQSVLQSLYRLESVEFTAQITMYSQIMGFTRTLSHEQIDDLAEIRKNLGFMRSMGYSTR